MTCKTERKDNERIRWKGVARGLSFVKARVNETGYDVLDETES